MSKGGLVVSVKLPGIGVEIQGSWEFSLGADWKHPEKEGPEHWDTLRSEPVNAKKKTKTTRSPMTRNKKAMLTRGYEPTTEG
jgi:carbonic anhydrase